VRLLPDEDALAFAREVRDLLAKECDAEALRAAWDTPDGRVPGLWQRLAGMGVLGLALPEKYGGAGYDLTFAVPLLVEAGRAALPEPLAETLTGAAVLAAAGGRLADEWLPRVVAGDATLAVSDGSPALTCGGRWADGFLLADGEALHLLRRDAVDVHDEPALDRGLGLASVTWAPTAGRRVDNAECMLAMDWACVAVAAELLGVARAMLDLAVDYAKVREQFGKPIGSFQAVKHQLADAFVDIAFAEPVVHRGAWSVVHDPDVRARDASHAKYAASRAALRAARTALQVHGGIGYTYEHDLHMWLKRTWSLTSMWGTTDWHKARVTKAVL